MMTLCEVIYEEESEEYKDNIMTHYRRLKNHQQNSVRLTYGLINWRTCLSITVPAEK
jgi:hypothetical protein